MTKTIMNDNNIEIQRAESSANTLDTQEDGILFEVDEPHNEDFLVGELYLFSDMKDPSDNARTLWGVFDKMADGKVCLESASHDMSKFDLWCQLPDEYKYYRLSTRLELRDYVMGLTYSQCAAHEELMIHL